MPSSRTDGERLASIEATLNILVQETSLIRSNNHVRLNQDNEWRGVVNTRLSLIEQGQKELIDGNKVYQDTCTTDRQDFEERLSGMEGLKRFIVAAALFAAGVVTLGTHIANALVSK